ncbi:MAG: hypothetical protein IPK35_00640 [Saprospiraceae bacterium]|jgi:hypothetical protein|nr:hypothetical protein [Saprospiraceae bacterium]
MKNYINIVCLFVLTLSLASCHKEYEPTGDLFDILGDVAQVSSMVSPVSTADANSTINLTIKCHALNTEIKELKFYQRIGTTGTYTFTRSVAFAPNFSEAERVHVLTVPYTVPNEKGKSFSLQVEAVTANNLVSARRTLSPTNVTIK